VKYATDKEKAEFLHRCKELAKRSGAVTVVGHAAARFDCKPVPRLLIKFFADENYLYVGCVPAHRDESDDVWATVVESNLSRVEWRQHILVLGFLEALRKVMILDDLADV